MDRERRGWRMDGWMRGGWTNRWRTWAQSKLIVVGNKLGLEGGFLGGPRNPVLLVLQHDPGPVSPLRRSGSHGE